MNEAAYLQSVFQINFTFYLDIPEKALVKVNNNNNNNNNNNTFILYSDTSKVQNCFTMTINSKLDYKIMYKRIKVNIYKECIYKKGYSQIINKNIMINRQRLKIKQ